MDDAEILRPLIPRERRRRAVEDILEKHGTSFNETYWLALRLETILECSKEITNMSNTAETVEKRWYVLYYKDVITNDLHQMAREFGFTAREALQNAADKHTLTLQNGKVYVIDGAFNSIETLVLENNAKVI